MRKQTRAELFLFFAAMIWGGTFVMVKLGIESAPQIFYTSLRFLISGIFFVSIFFKKIFPLSKSVIKKGFIIGFFLFVGFLAQANGLKITTASKSSFITGMLIVFTPLLQIFIAKKLPRIGNIIGVIVVMFGLYLLTSHKGSEFNFGDLLTLICAIFYSFYMIYLDVYSDENVYSLTFLQFLVVGVFAFIYSLFFESLFIPKTEIFFISLSYSAFLATLLTTFLQTNFQKETTPTKAAIIFAVEPVIASVMAYFLLNEQIGFIGYLGGGLILIGILISELWITKKDE